MAFKMKNPSMAKMAKMAGNNRAAMKMKMESAAKMKKDPALLPYFQFRMTAASGARTNAFLKF